MLIPSCHVYIPSFVFYRRVLRHCWYWMGCKPSSWLRRPVRKSAYISNSESESTENLMIFFPFPSPHPATSKSSSMPTTSVLINSTLPCFHSSNPTPDRNSLPDVKPHPVALSQCPQSLALPQESSNNTTFIQSFPALRTVPPVPNTYTAHYASFPTAFLTSSDIEHHWDDLPVEITKFNSVTTSLEDQFLDAVGRVSVNERFAQHIIKGSVIDYFGLKNPEFKYFATYTHLMDSKDAYIRIIAYNRDGDRLQSAHPVFGNCILVIPRNLNDVPFPVQLRFHALHNADPDHYPHEAHNHIWETAWNAMTPLEKVWWKYGRCAICDTDL